MTRPLVIALIGIDGAGKSTQSRWLAEWLTAAGVPATYFENFGGRPTLDRFARRLGRRDARALFGRRGFIRIEATIRWVMIARALAWSRLAGRVAVMDRYTYCEYAMIRARGDRGESATRRHYARFPRPDLVFLLQVAPVTAQQRVERRGKDTEELAYLQALDAAYRSLPEAEGFTLVDAGGTPAEVQATLRAAVQRRLAVRDAVAS